jgi:hypothetical protein
MLPIGMPVNGLRRKDDAMKSNGWYLNFIKKMVHVFMNHFLFVRNQSLLNIFYNPRNTLPAANAGSYNAVFFLQALHIVYKLYSKFATRTT